MCTMKIKCTHIRRYLVLLQHMYTPHLPVDGPGGMLPVLCDDDDDDGDDVHIRLSVVVRIISAGTRSTRRREEGCQRQCKSPRGIHTYIKNIMHTTLLHMRYILLY